MTKRATFEVMLRAVGVTVFVAYLLHYAYSVGVMICLLGLGPSGAFWMLFSDPGSFENALAWMLVVYHWAPITGGAAMFALARPIARRLYGSRSGPAERPSAIHGSRNLEVWTRTAGIALAGASLGCTLRLFVYLIPYGLRFVHWSLAALIAACLVGAAAGAALFAHVPRVLRFDTRRAGVREGLYRRSAAEGDVRSQRHSRPTLRETLAVALVAVGVFTCAAALAAFPRDVVERMSWRIMLVNQFPLPRGLIVKHSIPGACWSSTLYGGPSFVAGLALILLARPIAQLIYRAEPTIPRLFGGGRRDLWLRIAALALVLMGFQAAAFEAGGVILEEGTRVLWYVCLAPLFLTGAVLLASGVVLFALAPLFAGRQRAEVCAVQVDAQ
jgi:hypothetical protein